MSKIVRFGIEPELPYAIEEAINRLRINVSFLGQDVRKIMIVSADANEGKSFVSWNLWKQMALSGDKSILLDLDMRNSDLINVYDMSTDDGEELKGMSQFLSGNGQLSEYILHTSMPHGDIIPNAKNIVNPSMLLESSRLSKMLEVLPQAYRYVFVDAPPLGIVSDAEFISNKCDGAIMVVRGGVTSKHSVRNAMMQLQRAECPLLGTVVNRAFAGNNGRYGKYYGKYYGAYYGSSK